MRRLLLLLLCWIIPQIALASFADRPDVKNFISKMVHKHHFSKSELTTLFSQVKTRPSVIQSLKAPLEVKPWYIYQTLFVTEWRIHEGVAFWKKHQAALERAERIYGVPASIIVATIGVETKYGTRIGNDRVIDALANLAFSNSSRAPFFRTELEEFLLLTREQHLNPLKIMGSYAGAIGQPQFMPSSYRRYAVSFSGNRRIDLTSNTDDVIGSIANYYQKHGWKMNQPVAVKVHVRSLPFGFLTHSQPILPSIRNQKANFIELQGYYGREYWLGYPNFDVIKRYNPSNLYAMAVYQLSYQISMLKGKTDNA